MGGMFVWFLTFLITVDTTNDCLLFYKPLGRLAKLTDCHYVQPRSPRQLHHLLPPNPGIVTSDDDWKGLTFALHYQKGAPPQSPPHIIPDNTPPPLVPSPLPSQSPSSPTSVSPPSEHSPAKLQRQGLTFLSAMSHDEIVKHVHHPDTVLPPVRPCDNPNASNHQTQWSAKQLYRVIGCHTFKNYQNLLQVTCDGKGVGTGEFPFLVDQQGPLG